MAASLPDPALGLALWKVGRALVDAGLAGADHARLVAVLGEALNDAGVDVCGVEVACDAVDPVRANHFMRWRRDGETTGEVILSGEVFESMLREGRGTLRFVAEDDRFAAIMREGATDAVAFVHHLAPEATLGFFDDVMSLFATDRPGGFAAAEVDFMTRLTPLFALALGARLNAAAARGLLQTYLGQDAATALLDGRVGLGQVANIRAIVLYCDMVEFTAATEKLDAADLIDRLNTFFETITRPVSVAGGQVAGHVGDAVVMFFPVSDAESEPCLRATVVEAALDALAALNRLNENRSADLAGPLRARIGIDVGDVVHGNIGSPGRFSFTIIGTPVNRAARLQALAKDLGASLLMPADFAAAASTRCHEFGTHALNGFNEPVNVAGFRA